MLWSIILFLFLFTIIALAHEGGHFFAAKRAGIHVHEFGIGFGPRIFSKKFNGTTYSINLIPILAFVSLAGMDEPKEGEADIPENQKYFARPPIARFMMAFAGPFMNIVLAFLVLCFVFSFYGIPQSVSTTIDQVQSGSIAQNAGILSGDQIIGINGIKAPKMEAVIDTIHKSKDTLVLLKIKRGNKELSFKVTPKYNEKLKVALIGFTPLPVYEKANILKATYSAFIQTFSMVAMMFSIIWMLVTGAVTFGDLAGPVGIAQITSKYASTGIVSLLTFFAFLNVNIGILNLLPLPALDGGHIVFSLWEMITRRRVNEETQKKVHQWGLIALLCLMALVTINDVLRLFQPR